MARVAVFPQRVRVRVAPVKRKKTYTKHVVTPANWRQLRREVSTLKRVVKALKKRLKKAGL